jgi:hypothetical protein
MPSNAANKDRSTAESNRSSPNPGTTVRPSTRRNGPTTLIEELQDIKEALEGRKFLEKHSLLCPPGEPTTHLSLSTCLHQISMMSGVPKQAINAVRSVAFLLEEMEDLQINETIRDALDSQMTELTSDMKLLVEDAKTKISEHLKTAEERLAKIPTQPPPPVQTRAAANSYASVLVHAPAHANPRVAAREGIKARQFLVEGIKNSKFSHLDSVQLKSELNKILTELGSPKGKLRSVASSRNGGMVIEADSDEVAVWLSNKTNQRKLCDGIGSNAEFRTRSYSTIALNVPIVLNPENASHRLEICEANSLESTTITAIRWAKAIERRSTNQRTAHLFITFDNAEAANRAITNGLSICNRRCQVERTRREPIRCLKCQGWNHFAKDCIEEKDTCGNCAGPHRTASCLTSEKECVSCKSKDHASWSRACPTFTRKLAEYNNRNPENSLQYFPTADSWSWTATEPPATQISMQRPQLSKVQQGKKPQQPPKRIYDTYVPKHGSSYIPSIDTTGRGDEAGPSLTRPTPPPPPLSSNPNSGLSPPTQQSAVSNSDNSGHASPATPTNA